MTIHSIASGWLSEKVFELFLITTLLHKILSSFSVLVNGPTNIHILQSDNTPYHSTQRRIRSHNTKTSYSFICSPPELTHG